MENIIYVVVAIVIGVVIIVAINKSRSPISSEKTQTRQKEVFDKYLKWDSGLRDIFREASQDGATYMKHAPQPDSTDFFTLEETIAFYRNHDGNYEKRYYFLHERIGTKGGKWGPTWRQCEELPQDAIPIPE